MALSYQVKYTWYMGAVVDRTEANAYLRLKGTISDYNYIIPPPPPEEDITTDAIGGSWWAFNYTGEELPS